MTTMPCILMQGASKCHFKPVRLSKIELRHPVAKKGKSRNFEKSRREEEEEEEKSDIQSYASRAKNFCISPNIIFQKIMNLPLNHEKNQF